MLHEDNNHDNHCGNFQDDDSEREPDGGIGSRALCDLLSHAAETNTGGASSVAKATFFGLDSGACVRLELIEVAGAWFLTHTGSKGMEDHVIHFLNLQAGLDWFGKLSTYYRGVEEGRVRAV